jgi:hypothetical protein
LAKPKDPYQRPFHYILGGLEAAYDNPAAFRAFCHSLRREYPELNDLLLVQWYLDPIDITTFGQICFHDEFALSSLSDWEWQDPFDDCSYTVKRGLEIHAANARNLWHINLSAPRVLRSVAGDFAVQTVCVPASNDKPTIGGLVLWQDRKNFLRLDRGAGGKYEIFFGGCLDDQDVVIGRGRLDVDKSEKFFLRLERVDKKVNAFCSGDGEDWFTVGHIVFPVEAPVQVGLHAIGNIDRTIYHGAYPEGTAIRFESFQLWKM